MRKLARKSMAGTLLASLLFVAPLAVGAGERPEGHDPSGPETRLVGVVNVNTATPEQLQLLPGIGPSRSDAILEYRKGQGPFKQVGDLERVSGIGPAALDRIRPHCVVQGKTTARLER